MLRISRARAVDENVLRAFHLELHMAQSLRDGRPSHVAAIMRRHSDERGLSAMSMRHVPCPELPGRRGPLRTLHGQVKGHQASVASLSRASTSTIRSSVHFLGKCYAKARLPAQYIASNDAEDTWVPRTHGPLEMRPLKRPILFMYHVLRIIARSSLWISESWSMIPESVGNQCIRFF